MSGIASFSLYAFLAAAASLTMTTTARGHPHVLPTVRTGLIFSSDGRMTAVQHTWTYDSAYSTFVARDIDANKDGIIADDELAAFAKSQVAALAEHNYFTTVTAQIGSSEFGRPEAYSVERLHDGRFQLKFTVPFRTVLVFDKQFTVEIYDPNFFAYFTMAEDGVRLVGASNGCVSTVAGPRPIDLRNTWSIPAVFWQALDGSKTAGMQFVNRISVKCP